MSKKIDKLECARLVVEAAVLSIYVYNIWRGVIYHTISNNKVQRLHKGARQRWYRRSDELDTIIAASGKYNQEIYVGQCNVNTPLERQEILRTRRHNLVIYDSLEFARHQP